MTGKVEDLVLVKLIFTFQKDVAMIKIYAQPGCVGKAVVNIKEKHYLENLVTCVQETGD